MSSLGESPLSDKNRFPEDPSDDNIEEISK